MPRAEKKNGAGRFTPRARGGLPEKTVRTAAVFAVVLAAVFGMAACRRPAADSAETVSGTGEVQIYESFSTADIPAYSGEPSVTVNGDVPFFLEEDLTADPFESYAALDELGRCGAAFANICREIMPEEERGPIGEVRPSGWHTVKYAGIDKHYLYNRCHLIGYQLSGENANPENLITGTRYLNIEGMLPLENMVCSYVRQKGGHVLYRATPVFEGDNLLASGVLIEAESVEDKGASLSICRYCYNVQPGVTIDYATGESEGPPYQEE